MGAKSKIKWKNIYYMLTYAIDELSHMRIGNVDIENCNSLDDLFAALMSKAMELLYSNNYLSEYNKTKDSTAKPHGNILIQESYSGGAYANGKLSCEYFELSINSIWNIAIKSAIKTLLNYGHNISRTHKIQLEMYLDDLYIVENIDALDINIEDIDYHDLPEWYKPAIIVSKLIIKEMLSQDTNGKSKLFKLADEARLKYIFEKFVRNFYMLEYTAGTTSHPIFGVDGGRQNRLDMLIENSKTALVVDAKWYESTNNRANNIREVIDYILSYKEHEETICAGQRKETHGIVLYAMTDENEHRLNKMEIRSIGKNAEECMIIERTLNVNQDFDGIKNDLIKLADELLI